MDSRMTPTERRARAQVRDFITGRADSGAIGTTRRSGYFKTWDKRITEHITWIITEATTSPYDINLENPKQHLPFAFTGLKSKGLGDAQGKKG